MLSGKLDSCVIVVFSLKHPESSHLKRDNDFCRPTAFKLTHLQRENSKFDRFVLGYNASGHNVSDYDPCDCSIEINGTIQEKPCTEWEYDDSVFESTLVTQVT